MTLLRTWRIYRVILENRCLPSSLYNPREKNGHDAKHTRPRWALNGLKPFFSCRAACSSGYDFDLKRRLLAVRARRFVVRVWISDQSLHARSVDMSHLPLRLDPLALPLGKKPERDHRVYMKPRYISSRSLANSAFGLRLNPILNQGCVNMIDPYFRFSLKNNKQSYRYVLNPISGRIAR